ncbi:DUF3450 domain-containing protein [Paraneptunicella aestuarii]|uniref:DUF3450 domain-containing protein n=1 Tax=Paraneptunicella aestuarii TaxID=2831148 RepID=UPI001E330C33|nr:DUF3450 domain-containing protein [Paraneptunicella aestuarii]UAA37772.1 DUF3450 domain-containing protein [Paraneptunicella aestuarii]
MSKRNIIASTILSAFALSSSPAVSADPLINLQKEEAKTNAAAIQSQKRIDKLYEQTQDLLIEYRQVLDETENLKVYNDHVAGLVADQQDGINALQRQIDSIDGVKKGVVPLMYKMIDSLDQFIDLDVPINHEERKARVAKLRDLMGNSNVSTSEQFRQVLEAYQVELEYGSSIRAYQGDLNYNGTNIAVDFFNLGRTAMVALSLDQKSAWVWNNDSRAWEQLGDEYLGSVVEAVKMARKIVPVNLIKMPIRAAE